MKDAVHNAGVEVLKQATAEINRRGKSRALHEAQQVVRDVAKRHDMTVPQEDVDRLAGELSAGRSITLKAAPGVTWQR